MTKSKDVSLKKAAKLMADFINAQPQTDLGGGDDEVADKAGNVQMERMVQLNYLQDRIKELHRQESRKN